MKESRGSKADVDDDGKNHKHQQQHPLRFWEDSWLNHNIVGKRAILDYKKRMSLGVEQKPKPKLWAITKIGSCSIWIQEIPAYWPQHSGRKQEQDILPVHLFKKWKVKVKAKEYSSCFLPESCSQYAGIFCILIEQEPILVIAQTFGFCFCSTPIWNCTSRRLH